jgi:hypothetical protein
MLAIILVYIILVAGLYTFVNVFKKVEHGG